MMKTPITISKLIFYGLLSFWLGGLLGGLAGGASLVLGMFLLGFLSILSSRDIPTSPAPDESFLVALLFGCSGTLLVIAIIGGGLGLLVGTIAGPLTACISYLANPLRNWTKTGAVISGVIGTFLPLLITSQGILDIFQRTNNQDPADFLVPLASAFGGVLGGTVAGKRFKWFLDRETKPGDSQIWMMIYGR